MIQVAVIGAGALGEHHARLWSALPGAQLAAVVDIQGERARHVASQTGGLPCTDYRTVMHAVEAASVAVPTRAHVDVAVDLLERGIHVLVEKPMADTLEGADRMLEAAARGGAILQVGHSERFNPALRAVHSMVREPRFFEAHRLGVFAPRSLDIDVVLDLMIHDLDLIGWFVRSPVAEVRAVGIPILTSSVDIANARLEFADGCVANLTASRVSTEKVRKLRFFQADDYVSIDFSRQTAVRYSLVEVEGRRRIVDRSPQVVAREPLQAELEAFLGAVAGRAPVECTGNDGRAALALALRVLDAMRR